MGFPAPYIPLHDSYILIKNHIQKASNRKKIKTTKNLFVVTLMLLRYV